jgi:hypothetical protein
VAEDDEKISYIKLKGHILQAHPHTAAEKTFGVCDAIGTLPMCNCCFEREEVAHDPRMKGTTYVVRITPLAQQLGLGATLFMMTTKAMFWFFFWMSILNIPTMMFFYSGNVASIEAAEAVSGEAIDEDAGGFDVAQMYGRLSLGNIGQSLAGCVLADPNQDTRLMACSYGTMKTPETLIVGFAREDGVACGDEVDREIVDETCNSEASLFTDAGLVEMEAYFEDECQDRAMCDMPPPNIRDWLTPECQAAYDSRQAGQVAGVTNLEIVFQTACTSDTIQVPYTDYTIDKSLFGLIVVLVDVAVIIAFYVFTAVVRQRQLEYIREFKLQSIQMSDFTVRLEGLPCDLEYGDNEHVLRA